MNSRSKYKTKQRDVILKYLQSHKGVHVTAGDVCDYFKEQGTPVGQSTVYRQMESLVDEGVINKYIIDGNSPACFEYAEPESHCTEGICIHCKCEKCGRLLHMHCSELEKAFKNLLDKKSFKVDPVRTVIYGLCEECAGEE